MTILVMGDERQLLNLDTLRASQIVEVDIGDGVFVRAKRCDLSSMVFNGVVPTPIFQAALRFTENREEHPGTRLNDLDDEDRKAMQDVMRQHALSVVVEPKLTDDTVDLLTIPQLFAIWNATAVIPRVGAADAATFRRRQRPILEPVLRPGEVVRPTTKPVLDDAIDYRGA